MLKPITCLGLLVLFSPYLAHASGDGTDGQSIGKTLVFECEGFELVVRTGSSEITLYLPGRVAVLPQVRAASGVKYADNGILFWMKGSVALFELDGIRHGKCQRTSVREPQSG
jgi:membrane-bound inhibitor of C-type lysozyme